MKRLAIQFLWLALSLVISGPATAQATILRFEPDGMERIVASQNGRPFVLLVWSLDCEFCLASMKNLAQEKRTRKGFNVVTLTTDPIDDPASMALVRKKLSATGLAANAWAFGLAPPEQLRYAIDPKWLGEKPRSYWFNANGERVAYSGLITAATIARFADR